MSDWIKFLGTAGARYAVTRQLRRSGGIWVSLEGTQLLIDPGPGSLIRCLSSKPPLNPLDLDGIILSHRHIDHSNDMNIMIEAMTNGGTQKKGFVFAPSDAVDKDPVILHHFRNHVNTIVLLREGGEYSVGSIHFSTPVRHIHGVETYGLHFKGAQISVSIVTDTQYFDGLESYYPGDILILYTVLLSSKNEILHLSLEDAEHILSRVQPRLCILTHFGMGIIKGKPWVLASELSRKTGVEVIAASDGMKLSLDDIDNIHI
ncbi:MAG: MBL fold metallo-hydrolase [Candidatus Thermoplasmatota archaeon]|nr:MBL fold metallo-hydrolase [Candidatus Thermoplasmatota archaeon]